MVEAAVRVDSLAVVMAVKDPFVGPHLRPKKPKILPPRPGWRAIHLRKSIDHSGRTTATPEVL